MSLEPVVVVGAGLSGLAVALGSAIRGCSVVVLEADDLVGGAAAYSGGQVWVGGNHVAARQGIEDSLDLTERYVRGLSHAHPELLDEEAMKTWLEASSEAVRFVARAFMVTGAAHLLVRPTGVRGHRVHGASCGESEAALCSDARGAAPEIHVLGGACAPRRIGYATRQAYEPALKI